MPEIGSFQYLQEINNAQYVTYTVVMYVAEVLVVIQYSLLVVRSGYTRNVVI